MRCERFTIHGFSSRFTGFKFLFTIHGFIIKNDKRAEEASVIKAKYPVSYADAFCIELAKDMNLPIITGDPEFERVKNIVKVIPL